MMLMNCHFGLRILILLFSLQILTTQAKPSHCQPFTSTAAANPSATLCDLSFATTPAFSCSAAFPQSQSYIIQNNTPVTMALNYLHLQTNDSQPADQVSITANTCSTSLAPGATCSITITMTAAGPFNRVLQIGVDSRQAELDSPVITPTANCTASTSNSPCGLNSLSNFGILAGSTIANTGSTTIVGDLGLYPGTSITGFPPGTVTGSQQIGNSLALTAQEDLLTLYSCLAAQTCENGLSSDDLAGQTFFSDPFDNGVNIYCSTGSLLNTGVLTLDGGPPSVFIFQVGSSLTMGAGSSIVLTGGITSKNVFWLVGTSAAIGQGATFQGTIVANQNISFGSGATVSGRALAQSGAVTFTNNTITVP